MRYCLARLSDLLGMPKQATEHYEQALERAREMRAEPLRAQIGLDFSLLLRRLGQESRAAEEERDARSRAEAIGLALG